MSTKLFNLSGFFDGSPVLRRLRDSFFEKDSNLQPCQMEVSNVLVENNEVKLVVSCDGISTTLDIIIPEIETVKVNDELKNTSVDKSTSCYLITEQVCQGKQEVSKENIVSCPNTCNCDDCPFLKEDVPVVNVIMKESEPALDYKKSVQSIPNSITPQESNKRRFLRITSCKPIRDCQLVLHWNVESYKGVLGYRVSDLS
ncbi:unnamed protein product [Diamesa tonsa]